MDQPAPLSNNPLISESPLEHPFTKSVITWGALFFQTILMIETNWSIHSACVIPTIAVIMLNTHLWSKRIFWILLLNSFIPSIIALFHDGAFPYIVLVISRILLAGYLFHQKRKWLFTGLLGSFSLALSPISLGLTELFKLKNPLQKLKTLPPLQLPKIYLIPIALFGVFALLYGTLNPNFQQILTQFSDLIAAVFNVFAELFQSLNFFTSGKSIFTFIAVFFIDASLLIDAQKISKTINLNLDETEPVKEPLALKSSKELGKELTPEKMAKQELQKKQFTNMALGTLASLNGLLFLFHITDISSLRQIDIYSAPALSQAVHGGVFNSFMALTLAMFVILGLFRPKTNYIWKNSHIPKLTLLWFIQNGLLLSTTLLRDELYIYHFGLTDKRLGVLVVMFGLGGFLWLTYHKIRHEKSFEWITMRTIEFYYILLTIAMFIPTIA